MNTNNTKVAIFSDLHLGVHQNSSFWHETSLKWCKWFVSEVEKRNIKTILFLGDLFEYRDEVAVNTLDVGYQILTLLKDYNLIMIPGNHDSFYKDHADVNSLNIFSGWNNVNILNKTTVLNFGNKSAAFVPWGGELNTKTDYLFGHFEISSFRMGSLKLCNDGYDAFTMLKKAKRIFSGHFHSRDTKVYENGTITYVGNPFETTFGDCDNVKGIYFLDFATDEIEFVENTQSPKHIKLLASKVDTQGVVDNNIAGNIVKLVVDKKINVEDIEKMLIRVSSLAPISAAVEYLISKNKIDTAKDTSYDTAGVSMEDVMKEFIDLLDVNNKQILHNKCISIYNICK